MTNFIHSPEEQGAAYVTAIMDMDRLHLAKKRIAARDSRINPALDALRNEADQWCGKRPFSVMDKTLAPPSGDKHDYLSFGTYWWPDPSTPDGLPFIRRDGERYPGSIGPDSDCPGLEQMAAGAETLALAWYFTGDEKYARQSASYITTWFLDPATRMNPHLEYGQAIPGRCEGRGIGLIDTRHFLLVINALALLEGSSALTPAQRQELNAWFKAYLQWMRESSHGRDESGEHNNHGTWYDVQIAHFAFFTGAHDVTRATVESAIKTRLDTQVAADGSQPHELARTRSFSYSLMNLSGFLALSELGKKTGVDFWSHSPAGGTGLVLAAIDYMAAYADSHKPWTCQQIIPLNRGDLFPFIRQARVFTGDARYDEFCQKLPQRALQAHRANLLWPVP